MGWIEDAVASVKSIQLRQALHQTISLGLIFTSALMIWKTLMCVTGSESPVDIVLSESMEPGFARGDMLFLHMSKDPIRGREIPIVHRVIKVITMNDDDIAFYEPGQRFLQRLHIIGRAVGFLPHVGWATIIMKEKPLIKYILISAGLVCHYIKGLTKQSSSTKGSIRH